MTDLELLEMAAKAAGISLVAWTRFFDEWKFACNPCGEPWNPLIDDGDALRLVVKCKLHMGMGSKTVSAWAVDDFGNFQTEILAHRGDEAATRRAIVRAAAEIGRAMP